MWLEGLVSRFIDLLCIKSMDQSFIEGQQRLRQPMADVSQEQEIREWLEKPSSQSHEKLLLSGTFSTSLILRLLSRERKSNLFY